MSAEQYNATVTKALQFPPFLAAIDMNALHIQGTEGDCNVPRPATDALAQAKWDAWNKLKGMSTADANAGYVKITEAIMEKLANK